MKRNSSFLYCMLIGMGIALSVFDAQAQKAKFMTATSFGSSGTDESYNSKLDNNANLYIVGMGGGDIAFPGSSLSGRGGGDALLVKYDEDVTFKWARYVGGLGKDTFESLAFLSNGDVVVVGQLSKGDITIDGSETVIPVPAACGVVMLFDAEGNYKTHTLINSSASKSCIAYSVAVNANDQIFVTGSAIGETTFNNDVKVSLEGTNTNMFLAKYDTSLSCEWAIAGSSLSASYGWAIDVDKENNILMSGRFGGTIKIVGTDGKEVFSSVDASTSASDAFIAKFTALGECQWITYITNGDKRIDVRNIAADSNGNVFLYGHSNAAVAVEGQLAFPFVGNFDVFLVKFDKEGNYVNGFSNGGAGRDEGKGIFVDKDNHVYVAGNMNGSASGTTINMNPKGAGASVDNIICYGHDGLFAKYNGESLELMQVEKTTSPSGSTPHEVAWCVSVDKNAARIYSVGYFNNANTVFDGKEFSLPNAGAYDFFVVAYSSKFVVKTTSLPAGTVGEAYYSAIAVDNAQGDVTVVLKQGALPGGLCLENGVVSGIATVVGSFTFTLSITDGVSVIDREYTVAIANSGECDIFINTDQCDDAVVGQPYLQQLDVLGSGFICTITGGTLPTGLTLSAGGAISGTPSASNSTGIYTFKVQAAGAACSDEIELRMILNLTTSSTQLLSMTDFIVSPTFAKETIDVVAKFNSPQRVSLRLVNLLGASVWESQLTTNHASLSIPAHLFPNGNYFIVLVTDEGSAVKRCVIVK